MNDELHNLERRLRDATSDRSLPGESVDEETRTLRQSWRGLGAALKACESPVDEAALVESVVGSVLAERDSADRSCEAGEDRPSRWARRRRIALAVASAAALLLALAVTWRVSVRRAVAPRAPETPLAAGNDSADVADSSGELAWDDSLDEELATAVQAIALTRSAWNGNSASFEAVDEKLREMQQELEQGAL